MFIANMWSLPFVFQRRGGRRSSSVRMLSSAAPLKNKVFASSIYFKHATASRGLGICGNAVLDSEFGMAPEARHGKQAPAEMKVKQAFYFIKQMIDIIGECELRNRPF